MPAPLPQAPGRHRDRASPVSHNHSRLSGYVRLELTTIVGAHNLFPFRTCATGTHGMASKCAVPGRSVLFLAKKKTHRSSRPPIVFNPSQGVDVLTKRMAPTNGRWMPGQIQHAVGPVGVEPSAANFRAGELHSPSDTTLRPNRVRHVERQLPHGKLATAQNDRCLCVPDISGKLRLRSQSAGRTRNTAPHCRSRCRGRSSRSRQGRSVSGRSQSRFPAGCRECGGSIRGGCN